MLTLVLAILDTFAVPTYTALALRDIRPGYKLVTVGGIAGALCSGLLAIHFSIVSLGLYLYLVLCITATGIALTKGRPASLFDWAEIYGHDDREAFDHDKGLGKRQALYLLILLAEGAPAIYYAR